MAIKGFKRDETVSVFDPVRNAYYETPIAAVEKQLKALGFSEEAIAERIAALKKAQGEKEA